MIPSPENLFAVGPVDYRKIVSNVSFKQRILEILVLEKDQKQAILQLLDEEVRSKGMSSVVLEAFQDS